MKALAKSLLCSAWKYTGLMHAAEALLNHVLGGHLAILLFHRVTNAIPEDGLTISVQRFRSLCQILQRGFRVIPLAEAFRLARAGGAFPPRTVAITFDDCYRDNLDAAYVLAEFGLPACFFIPTGFVGTSLRFDWDRHLPPLPNLTWADVREMSRLGFEIGSHTVTHPDMGRITAAEARRELAESKAVLEAQLERHVRWFAYPYGGRANFRPEWLPLLREAGYEGCVSGFGGFLRAGAATEILPREAVPYFQHNLNLELYLSGTLHWYYGLKRRRLQTLPPAAVVPPEVVAAQRLSGEVPLRQLISATTPTRESA